VHGTNFVLPGAARAAGVLTIHDLDFFDYPDELPPGEVQLPELVRVSARRADAICTPTATVADRVAERLDVDRAKITVTPLGVDPSWFTAMPPTKSLRGKLHLPNQYLLFIGAAGPRKGLRWLSKAHQADPGLPPLVYIGPGAFDLSPRTQHLGYLADVELRSVVAGASALVLPSRDEGFGLPVLEAMACDVPVVCTDVPALREVAGGHAQLVGYGDIDGLIAALTTAVADAHTPAASAARRAHAATFTWRRCAELTVAAYREAIG
jgi:glycosyltransferase involved in cell wall biosynthesis